MNLTSLGTSCKWNPSVSALLCMASLKLPPVKKDCILVFARNPCICPVVLMTVFAQCREKDDKNLPNHWLGRWVEVTACFPSQRSATFLSWNAWLPSLVLPLGQRSGMVSNPEWAGSSCWCCGEGRQVALLQTELERQLWFLSVAEESLSPVTAGGYNFQEKLSRKWYVQRPSKKEGASLPFFPLEEKSVVRSCLSKWLPFWSLLFFFLELQMLAIGGWSKVDIGGMRGQRTASQRMQTGLHWCGPQAPVQGGRPPVEETGEPCRLPLKSSFCLLHEIWGPRGQECWKPYLLGILKFFFGN